MVPSAEVLLSGDASRKPNSISDVRHSTSVSNSFFTVRVSGGPRSMRYPIGTRGRRGGAIHPLVESPDRLEFEVLVLEAWDEEDMTEEELDALPWCRTGGG